MRPALEPPHPKAKEATQDTWAASMLADQSCRLTAGYTQPVLR
jgi:hypothetical protein